MAYRNMRKLAEETSELFLTEKNLSHYGMNILEMTELHQMCLNKHDIEALRIAFNYGFALGTRAHEKKRIPAL